MEKSNINESFLKIAEQKSEDHERSDVRKLLTDPSGQSLAYSRHDQSSLKYSKAQDSAVHEMVNKKLDEELVLEISHFSGRKLLDFIDSYMELECVNLVSGIVNAGKVRKMNKKVDKNTMRYCFDGLIINKEYEQFDETKNCLKV